jgi:hypothetical protein
MQLRARYSGYNSIDGLYRFELIKCYVLTIQQDLKRYLMHVKVSRLPSGKRQVRPFRDGVVG